MSLISNEGSSNLQRLVDGKTRIKIELPPGSSRLPVSLSIGLPGGYVDTVAPCGQHLPCSITKKFSTASSFQMAVEFVVLAGLRPLTQDNVELCRIRVRNIKWGGSGSPQLEVTFTISEDGDTCIRADNLDQMQAEILSTVSKPLLQIHEVEQLIEDSRINASRDEATKNLIKTMMECYAMIGATNDCFSVAKRKMGFSEKKAYKKARKDLEAALSVDPCNATEESVANLVNAAHRFRAQRDSLSSAYQGVMKWWS